jgi:hypothetical protein
MKNHNGFPRRIFPFSLPLSSETSLVMWMGCFTRQTVRLLLLLVALSCVALAQLPGDPAPNGTPHTGSVLVYNYYSSTIPATDEDTVFELTNNHKSDANFVHLFFVEGNFCSPADIYFCVAPRDTVIFRASDLVPMEKGYLIAIATGDEGVPINFNFLSGNEEIKLASGHKADFAAVAIPAIASNPAPTPPFPVEATMNFDGIHYDKVPRVLELERVYSVADGNSTLLIVNRLNRSLALGGFTLGVVEGILTNLDTGTEYAFSDAGPGCQLKQILSDTFPAIMTPVFSVALPAKQEGNLKIWATADLGVSGAAINFNTARKGKKLNSGDNLRAVTVTTASIVVPVFVPAC